MSHKCACCFLQASPGCGYKWYHIKCWHPVLTMLAPHLQVQDTNYFLRKFLHVYRYLAPLVMICQFGGFFFWELGNNLYVCAHILLPDGAASAWQSVCIHFVWDFSWYLSDIIVTLIRLQSGLGFYQLLHETLIHIWNVCNAVLGDLVLKHHTLCLTTFQGWLWNLHVNGTIAFETFCQALGCNRHSPQDKLFCLTFSFYLRLFISPWSWVLTAWMLQPSVYPPYVHIKGHMVYTKAYIRPHL